MKIGRKVIGRSRGSMLCVCLMLLGAGCVTIDLSRGSSEDDPQGLSPNGTVCEAGRGATNVAFCWLELPAAVEGRIRRGGPGHPFGIISGTFHALCGTVCGTVRTVQRGVGGVVEVGLSPFPPYEPLMDPAFPPYLNIQRAPAKEECCCEDRSCEDEH
jgi:putative exosortase-associated protein (TIGR04073 family)